jgi:LuxR family maltose regulon positive regulatory protein
MSKNRARVYEQWVADPAHVSGHIRLDSVAWFVWLDATSTTGFAYPLFDPQVGYIVGFMSVRKERKQRGGDYWVAYRRYGGYLRKAYLGSSRVVTAAHLHQIAQRLWGKEVPPSNP